MVWNDTVYLYTGHDEDTTEPGKGFLMYDWQLYKSVDMVNWTDCGPVADLTMFPWGPQGNGAWALHVIPRNGKFYLYAPLHCNGMGVAVSDSPYGPFRDPLGHHFINNSSDDIDPAAFIDDDGQAYLYWGNPNLYYVKLNDDMISYDTSIGQNGIVKTSIDYPDKVVQAYKGNPLGETFYRYQEGPWLYKRRGLYYLAYASECCPEAIGYAMSTSPTGPWECKGHIMSRHPRSNGNHPGIIDYKGRTYCFGFSYNLHWKIADKHAERRSVHVTEIKFNADGTIVQSPFWDEQQDVQPVGEPLNPHQRVEAETMAWGWGLKTAREAGTGVYVTHVDEGEYIRVRNVDLGRGPRQFLAQVRSRHQAQIEVRLDAVNGTLIATLDACSTKDEWTLFKVKCLKAKGIHDLYLVFRGKGSNLLDFDYWMMK